MLGLSRILVGFGCNCAVGGSASVLDHKFSTDSLLSSSCFGVGTGVLFILGGVVSFGVTVPNFL